MRYPTETLKEMFVHDMDIVEFLNCIEEELGRATINTLLHYHHFLLKMLHSILNKEQKHLAEWIVFNCSKNHHYFNSDKGTELLTAALEVLDQIREDKLITGNSFLYSQPTSTAAVH